MSLEDNLSQSVVYFTLQDSEGFLWFGTQLGLNRFDGYQFRIYKHSIQNDNSISHDYVRTAYEDKNGTLWFGFLNGAVASYNRENDNFVNYLPGTENNLKDTNQVMSICEYGDGDLMIGTFGSGLKTFDKIKKEIKSFSNDHSINLHLHEISAMITCSENEILIGTWNDGLYLYDRSKECIKNHKNQPGNIRSISDNRIYTIFEDNEKNIWIGTNNGLNLFIQKENYFEQYYHNPGRTNSLSQNRVSAITQDKDNFIWIGTKEKGLNRFDLKEKVFLRFDHQIDNTKTLSNNSIIHLYVDKSNVLWVGTFGGGISKLDCGIKKFYFISRIKKDNDTIVLNDIHSVFKDKTDHLWLGTYNKGLYKLDASGNNIHKYELEDALNTGIGTLTPTCFCEDENSNLWIGTIRRGLNKYTREKDDLQNFALNGDSGYYVFAISADNKNRCLWVGLGLRNLGLFRFNLDTLEFEELTEPDIDHINISKIDVRALILDKNNILWIGTYKNGLIRYDIQKQSLDNYLFDKNDCNSISQDSITSLYESVSGNIWVGTYSGGLNLFDVKSNSFRRFNEEKGLHDNDIRGTIEDEDGSLWISTNGGIYKFNPQSGDFKHYDERDGLQSREFNIGAFHKSRDGTMYFGGINGLNYFKGEEIKDNISIPRIVITDFQIFNESVNHSTTNPFLKQSITGTREINLSYKESVFSFEFASLIYNNPMKNKYAYKMEGFDNDWIYSGSRRFATYTNLEPGEYTFRVKGSNNDGVWNQDGASVKIEITPPFWKTWWFKSLGIMSVVGATGMAYRQKLAKVEQDKKSQEEFSRRLIDSQEQERKRIATELHHTVAHDVLITKHKAVLGLKQAENPDKIRNILNEISELSSITLNDVRGISYNLHPHQIEALGLTKAVKSIVNNASKSTTIDVSASIDDIDKLLTEELEINVFRIVQECFSNIIKHSEATQSNLSISKTDQFLNIVLTDNGKGFSRNQAQGLGLRSIYERVKLYSGSVSIDSEAGKGTTTIINIPIIKKQI